MDHDVPPPPILNAPSTPGSPALHPPQRRARPWLTLVVVASGLAVIGAAGIAVALAVASALGGPSRLHLGSAGKQHLEIEESVLEDNDATDKIAVVNVSGVIGSSPIDATGLSLVKWIKDQLEKAGTDAHVKAVVLKIDSPGGEVLASDEIYELLRKFQSGPSGKPVVASMGNLAASGGYYIAAPCRWIVAHPLTITGSIGVIMHGYNYHGLMDKLGIRPQVFKSGRFKDMLSSEKPPGEVTEEEKAMVQDMINETYGRFKTAVRDGRGFSASENGGEGRRLVDNWTEFADGRILSGTAAFEHGFVDELGNFEAAVGRAVNLAGLRKANVVTYEMPFALGRFFRLLGRVDITALRLNLGLQVPSIVPGRLYFLWQPATP